MRLFILLTFLGLSVSLYAQQQSSSDTTKVLDEAIVKAYRSDRPLVDVPATVNVLSSTDLVRFGPTSLVTTVNTVPGVRMEERSPGSYRFSIRGSVLRSPFGIRNVKFYWKGLPFTDGGGNTYLNLLDMSTIGGMEILKGPGASLYGASTGGVVLMDSQISGEDRLTLTALTGSYGLRRFSSRQVTTLGRRTRIEMGLSWQKSDGYRQQAGMRRANVSFNLDHAIGKNDKLSITYIYGALQYQTPGGLNKAQYEADARQARPASPTAPGAISQQAKINNNTSYLATSYVHDWNEHWSTNVGVYGSTTYFANPAILNYEYREEYNGGGRTETQYKFGGDMKHKITFGAEYQVLQGPITVYENIGGTKGNLRTDDNVRSRAVFTFAQAEFQLPYRFMVTAGGSLNYLKYNFKRLSTDPNRLNERNFKPGFFPRVALIKKFNNNFSVYGSYSEGFSAPTLAEVLPSTSILNTTLNAEKGRSLEVGVRGEFFERRLKLNVTTYDFKLRETIVVRTTEQGADYFTNAGTTSQKGIESTISFVPWRENGFDVLRIWTSYTYNNYHFLNYVSGTTDFSGNRLTGVPPTVFVGGVDLNLKYGWYLNASVNYTDHIPVNDANTEFAHDYKIVSARVGKRFDFWKVKGAEVFLGVDNALDQKYSLGNDLNAAGGRYYNVATGRNFYGGVTLPLFPYGDPKNPK